MAVRFRKSGSTTADHLNQLTEKISVFSSAIMAVTKVNSELETLIVNDSALAGAPDDPIILFELENFKQKVRGTITSSRDVKNAIRSLAGYSCNLTQIERLKEELRSQPHGDYPKLKEFLKVIGERISRCRKLSERSRPKYDEARDLVLNWDQQRPRSAQTATTRVTRHTWLKRGLVVAVTVLINELWVFGTQHIMPSPTENSLLSTMAEPVSLNIVARRVSLRNLSRMCIFGLLCLGFFCLIKRFKSHRYGTHQDPSAQPSIPNRHVTPRSSSLGEAVSVQPSVQDRDVTEEPTTYMFGTHTIDTASHSVIMSISCFLETMKDHECQLQDLEQRVRETVDCIDNGQDIGDIEVELDKLAREMESILPLTDQELSFSAGDVIFFMECRERGHYCGMLDTGLNGLFPTSHVEPFFK